MAGIGLVKRVRSGQERLDRFQDGLAGALNPVLAVPLLNGLLLTGLALAMGDNTVAHKLERTLIGWMVVRIRAAATVFDKQDANPNPSRTLVLNASAATIVDLWVF